jgi:hypothetical protein
MLVGFFLSIGMQGLPTAESFLAAVILCLFLPFKTFLYYLIVIRYGLRSRTSLFTSLSLANYSEFGLIVSALGVTQGWLPVQWLLVVAIAVSLSFAIASPFSSRSEVTYQRLKSFWERFETHRVHPRDRIIDAGSARVLIVGMGRVGMGTYDELSKAFNGQILGIEHDAHLAESLHSVGRNVLIGDATDTDFWNKLRMGSRKDLIVLAMPNHKNNIFAAQQIRAAGVDCQVVAIAKFPEEVEELSGMGIPSFNMYSEAGASLARHALEALSIRERSVGS